MSNYRDRMAYRIDCLTQENRSLRKQLASAMEQLADRDIAIEKLALSLDEINKILHSSRCINHKRERPKHNRNAPPTHHTTIRRLQPRELVGAQGLPIVINRGDTNEIPD